MAVLKDLIVHGSSRFLNAAYFNQLKANDLAAEQGYFNKLIAVDGKISSLNVDDLTAQNATVIGLLDVKGELHTNSWTNANIATIDGSFYITPTVSCESGTFAYDGTNITVTAASGYSFGVDSLYTYTTSGTATTYTSWPQYSRVLLTGEVKLSGSNEWQPLGTIRGQIVNSSTSSIKINSLYDSQGTTPIATLADLGSTSITNANFRKVKVSLYERASSSSSFFPIGIYMTALGAKGKTFIDIYGGGDAKGSIITNSIDSGAMAKPVLRIGNLSGLPVLTLPNGTSVAPQGWGIYTNNGFFQGTIVSTQGKIGNFTLSTAIYGASSGTGPTTVNAISTAGTYLGTDGFLNTASSTTYAQITGGVLTAQGAVISGTIDATSFKARDSNQKVRAEVNTNGLLIYDSDGTVVTNGTLLAQFGSTTQIGKSAQAHINITSGGLDLYKGTTLIGHWGYDSNSATNPYFTFGTRDTTTELKGSYSVVMGYQCIGIDNYSFAQGYFCQAKGVAAHAEGYQNIVYAQAAHAEGQSNTIDGNSYYSHAEGYNNTINGSSNLGDNRRGYYAHVGGVNNIVNHDGAFVHGQYLQSTAAYQALFGKYNDTADDALLIIGNGTDENNRSNLMVIGDNYARIGNQDQSSITISPDEISGKGSGGKQFFKFANSTSSTSTTYSKSIYRGPLNEVPYTLATALSVTFPSQAANSSELRIDFQIDNGSSGIIFPYGTATTRSLTKRYNDINYTLTITYDGALTFTDIYLTTGHASLDKKISINGFYTIVSPAPTYILGGGLNIEATGAYSYAEGYDTHATGAYSYATGYDTYATGNYSHAEGYENKALGIGSHAEGIKTIADGYYSHAEGQKTEAVGTNSHTEGFETEAVGTDSHAEGTHSIALGKSSHAQNLYTVATEIYQTVIGKYNACTVSGLGTTTNPYTYTDAGDYAFIIGNGTSNTTAKRSNAFMVDWSGDIYPQATKMTDFIIEQGTSGIWTYRKWNSGIAECWGKSAPSAQISTAWGTGYASAVLAATYPSGLFIDVPSVQLTNAASWEAIPMGYTHTKDSISYQLFRASSMGSGQTFSVSIHAIGRWK